MIAKWLNPGWEIVTSREDIEVDGRRVSLKHYDQWPQEWRDAAGIYPVSLEEPDRDSDEWVVASSQIIGTPPNPVLSRTWVRRPQAEPTMQDLAQLIYTVANHARTAAVPLEVANAAALTSANWQAQAFGRRFVQGRTLTFNGASFTVSETFVFWNLAETPATLRRYFTPA